MTRVPKLLGFLLPAWLAIGCGGAADPCAAFTAAYCAKLASCPSQGDACANQSGFKDNVTSKCQSGIAAGKSTAADFDSCTAHLRAVSDCGLLDAPGNPCANATNSFK